uniref:ATPase H+ transporting accessory protein 1 n=1 Tax=Labrus bergylta TaxID=56723 RepID=A0A3Q3F0W6_9LABR
MAFIALLFALFSTGSSTAQVPVLLWSSDGLPALAPSAAGHITSTDQLTAYLTSALGSGPRTVVLFLQDKLSKDDFTVFGGVFGNKQDSAFQNLEAALQTSSSSVTLPALEWSGSSAIPALLQEELGVSPLLVDADTLTHLSINSSASNLLLINLPYYEKIGKVLSIMKDKNVKYTAVYTGSQPSRVISETSLSGQPVGRSLLQAAPPPSVKPPIMFNGTGGPCIMLWAQNLNISLSSTGAWIDLAADTPTLTGSFCNITLTFHPYSPNTPLLICSFAMSQRFYPVSARNCSLTASFGSRSIYAPAEYSYHCMSVSSFGMLCSSLTCFFSDFSMQIQGFSLGNGTDFSYASDCAGFFTAGIWMGLLSSLLMLFIFVYGLHMIMQLHTMDRFDDPKGPSISVPQSE